MTETHLERAIENLDHIDIVGTVERYAQWLGLAQSILARAFPGLSLMAAYCNVTKPADPGDHVNILDHLVTELGPDLAERLLKCNELDMRLHQVADSLLARRLTEHGVEVRQRDAYAKARQKLSGKSIETS